MSLFVKDNKLFTLENGKYYKAGMTAVDKTETIKTLASTTIVKGDEIASLPVGATEVSRNTVISKFNVSQTNPIVDTDLNLACASPSASATWLGKTISSVQTDVTFTGCNVTGTLKYVNQWDEFETGAKGNFLCIKATADTGTTISMRVYQNGVPVTQYITDADGEFILHLANTESKVLEVLATKNGTSEMQMYDLSNLVLEDS